MGPQCAWVGGVFPEQGRGTDACSPRIQPGKLALPSRAGGPLWEALPPFPQHGAVGGGVVSQKQGGV